MPNSRGEGETTARLVARLAPPLDSLRGLPCPGEMMGYHRRLGFGNCRKMVTQAYRDPLVQHLPAAPEQAFISCILNERVLEYIYRVWWHAAPRD
jgi:hypothetical protein